MTSAIVCGVTGDPAPIPDVSLDRAEQLAVAGLDEPDRHAAIRTMDRLLTGANDRLSSGLLNSGLFATHELREGVPLRVDWPNACTAAQALLRLRGLPLIQALGYSTAPSGSSALLLSDSTEGRAVAVLLDETETFDRPSSRFGAVSPVTHGITVANRERLPWLIVLRGGQVRLYPARPDVGVGRKGQTETYTELDLALLDQQDAGYLTLLFAPAALCPGGSVEQILTASTNFAADLGRRLRDRIYVDVVPSLAVALARRMNITEASSEYDLDEAYHRTLLILFRLLFCAYAEDRGLLPYGRNARYDRHAVKALAKDFAADPTQGFDPSSTALWDAMTSVWSAVDEGNSNWDVPPYDGGLFSRDPQRNPAGASLATLRLSDAEFGPVLAALLVDESDDGTVGPVDFRSLSVREFGTIYEGLLESSLSVAPVDLILDPDGAYIPADAGDTVEVGAGQVYFHHKSGQRKSTGSYFTKGFAVDHLLDTALEPALHAHLHGTEAHLRRGDEAAAADAFFDFRVADLAMGSGHFLVAAIDRIEAALSAFLTEHPIPAVTDELARLQTAASAALGEQAAAVEIETSALLRRQIARRCIYGLDLNLMAVELARLAVWVHTFVPGLPMSALDHGLVEGNSLTGITSVDEVIEVLDPDSANGTVSIFRDQIDTALGAARDRLIRVARTSEATKQEVAEAAAAHTQALADATDAQALFDVAVAIRLGLIDPPVTPGKATPVSEQVREALDGLKVIHFPVRFPEVFLRDRPGFDCLVGNPPWDKVRHEPAQFWVIREPGLKALSARQQEAHIEDLRAERPVEAALERREITNREQLKEVARTGYRLQGSQHYDLAKLFAERNITLARPDTGTVGVVLPQASMVVGGWSRLRNAWLANAALTIMQTRNTNGWLFEGLHAQVPVVLVARQPVATDPMAIIHPAVTSLDRLREEQTRPGLAFTVADLRELSDDLIVPWFTTADDPAVFNRMRTRPSFGSGHGWITGRADSTRWDFSATGRHARYVSNRDRSGAWRVMMTRHVDAYGIASDSFQRFVPNPAALIRENRGVERADGQVRLSADHPAVVYRFPTNNDNTRTLIATVLPASGYLFSKGYVHGIALEPSVPTRDMLALLGYMNSLVADWWARRFVERHLGARIILGLPLPDWDTDTRSSVAAYAEELVVRNGVTDLPGGRTLGRRRPHRNRAVSDLRILLDALAFRGLGLGPADSRTIFADFKETPQAVPVDYRTALLDALTTEGIIHG
jgi:hypothetical protein